MDRFELQALRHKPIEAVAGRLGISVVRHKALCPFHDDHHASLSFSPRRNACRCFVCMDRGLGPIDLVMRLRGAGFLDACRWLTEADGGVWTGPGGGRFGGSAPGNGAPRNGSFGGGSSGNGRYGSGVVGTSRGGGFGDSSFGNSGFGGGSFGNSSFGNGSPGNGSFGNGSFGNGGLGNGSLEDGNFGNGNLGNGSYGGGSFGNGNLGNGSLENGNFGNGSPGNGSLGDGNFGNGNLGNGSFGGGGLGGGAFSGSGEAAGDRTEPVFDAARYERFFRRPWLSDEARRFLFTERRLDERVVRWCRLTSWTDRHGTPWLSIPYYDQQGRLIGVQNRNLARQPAAKENRGASPSNGNAPSDGGGGTALVSPASGGEPSKREDLSSGEPSKRETPTGGSPSAGGIPGGGEAPKREDLSAGKPPKWETPSGGSLSPEWKPTADESGAPGGIPVGGEAPKAESPAAEVPRFRFPRGARCSVYGLQIVPRLKDGDELYITEGCSDCWAMLSSGRKAIAVPSATLLSPADARLLTDLGSRLHLRWHMYPDRDLPGETLYLQLRRILPTLVHHQLPPGCKDYSEMFCGLRPL